MVADNSDNSTSASGDDAQPTGLFGKFFGAKKNYKKAKLGQSLSMYYHEEVCLHQPLKISNSPAQLFHTLDRPDISPPATPLSI
jgi:uncharacterized Fe-S cluster protein YjdI